MIASMRQRFGDRLNFQSSFTLGHATDYYQGGSRSDGRGNIPDPTGLRSYRADSSYDVRKHLSASGVYRLATPFKANLFSRAVLGGWEISATAILESGQPSVSGQIAVTTTPMG